MRFYVNVDHVATVREARRTVEPDPVEAARACLTAGADGITVHLREDRRHIHDDDVRRIAEFARGQLNLELASAPDIIALAKELQPHQVTFVPERREEITTEGGLDLNAMDREFGAAVRHLQLDGIRISLFIDPDPAIIDAAARFGVAAVELHTGEYANAWPDAAEPLQRLEAAAEHAQQRGLAVHAGHGLTYKNVTSVAAIPAVEELNIGHSVVSRSIMIGMPNAVRDMKGLIDAVRVDRNRTAP